MRTIKIIGFIILTCSLLNVKSQEIKIKEGVYRNMVDFQRNKPFLQNVELKFEKSSKKKPIYLVSDKKRKINTQTFDFGAWAIYSDSCLYINLKRLGMGMGYAKILELGRYSFFIGRRIVYGSQKKQFARTIIKASLFGLPPSSYSAPENGVNNLYLMNLQKGVPENLTIDYMKFILRDDEELLNKYLMEQEKASLDVMIKYVKKLNSKLPLY